MVEMASPVAIIAGGDLGLNIASFGRHPRAVNLSPRTQETYTEGARQFAKILADHGMPQEVVHSHREHVEAFISYLLDRWKPATANKPANWFPDASDLQFYELVRHNGLTYDQALLEMLEIPGWENASRHRIFDVVQDLDSLMKPAF